MTTTAPRYKAGGLPPTQLHRVNTIEQLEPDDGVTVTPIQFAGDEPEDGGPEMLAAVIVLTVVCVALGFFIAGLLS